MPCSVRACAVHVVTVGTTKACKRAAGPAFIGRRIRVVFSYVRSFHNHGQCFTMRWSITKCRLSSVSCYCQEQRLPCACGACGCAVCAVETWNRTNEGKQRPTNGIDNLLSCHHYLYIKSRVRDRLLTGTPSERSCRAAVSGAPAYSGGARRAFIQFRRSLLLLGLLEPFDERRRRPANLPPGVILWLRGLSVPFDDHSLIEEVRFVPATRGGVRRARGGAGRVCTEACWL